MDTTFDAASQVQGTSPGLAPRRSAVGAGSCAVWLHRVETLSYMLPSLRDEEGASPPRRGASFLAPEGRMRLAQGFNPVYQGAVFDTSLLAAKLGDVPDVPPAGRHVAVGRRAVALEPLGAGRTGLR